MDMQEAMQAALIFAVKTAEGKSYEDFVTELKLKTSQSPFNSSHYNASRAAWAYRVSINIMLQLYFMKMNMILAIE